MKPSWWHPISRYRYIKQRTATIKDLRDYIQKTEMEELANAKGHKERMEARMLASAMCRGEWCNMVALEQEDILGGLDYWNIDLVGEENFFEDDEVPARMLTSLGEKQARKAINEARRNALEAWGKAITPWLSSVISILSLLVALAALHKK